MNHHSMVERDAWAQVARDELVDKLCQHVMAYDMPYQQTGLPNISQQVRERGKFSEPNVNQ